MATRTVPAQPEGRPAWGGSCVALSSRGDQGRGPVSPVVGLEPGDALFHPHTAALVKAGLHRSGWAHTGQAGRGNLQFDESPDRGLYFIFGRIM